MQRQTSEGVVIACDFCGTDWDEVLAMIEGHHGSILCLECFKQALAQAVPGEGEYACVMCLQEHLPPALPRWEPPQRSPNGNPQARICHDCILQAAKTYDRDPDVEWRWQR